MADTVSKLQSAPGPSRGLAAMAANMPASYFGIVLGLAGLGNAWRAAARAWELSALVGDIIHVVAALVWAVLIILYVMKAITAPAKFVAEAEHPVQCCFVGLAGVSTMLVAGGLAPHWTAAAYVVFALGFAFTLAFGVWYTGSLWQGGRDISTTTAVLYLPTVAGSFVSATVISALGHPEVGQLAFGAGLFSWLAMESVILNRLLTGPTLAIPMRPTMGVQLAPAPVGAVAYIAVSGGVPDLFVHALIGYGVLQLLILARLWRWIFEAGSVPGLWAFSFGITAIATAPTLLTAHEDGGAIPALAALLFVFANIFIAALIAMTLSLITRGRMFQPA